MTLKEDDNNVSVTVGDENDVYMVAENDLNFAIIVEDDDDISVAMGDEDDIYKTLEN